MVNEPPHTRPVRAVVREAHSGGKPPEPPTRLALNLYMIKAEINWKIKSNLLIIYKLKRHKFLFFKKLVTRIHI